MVGLILYSATPQGSLATLFDGWQNEPPRRWQHNTVLSCGSLSFEGVCYERNKRRKWNWHHQLQATHLDACRSILSSSTGKVHRCRVVNSKLILKGIFIAGLHLSSRHSMLIYWEANQHATLHNYSRHATLLVKFRERTRVPTSSTRDEIVGRLPLSKSSSVPSRITPVMTIGGAEHSFSSSSSGGNKKKSSRSRRQKKFKMTLSTVDPIVQQQPAPANRLQETSGYCLQCPCTGYHAEQCPVVSLNRELTLLD